MSYAVFCADPLNPRSPDPAFATEVAAAKAAGLTPILIDHDELDHRIDAQTALRPARISESGSGVYRGWMLRSEAYLALFSALAARGITLRTSPAAYDACHHAPGSYEALRPWMAHTRWLDRHRLDDATEIEKALAAFAPGGVIIKDWVKSQAAGYWLEACYIPEASDLYRARKVIDRFRDLQGDSLVGGVVFRQALSLLPAGRPPEEFRAFVLNGAVLGCWPRSGIGTRNDPPPADLMEQVAAKIPSPFASADFARDEQGQWWLLEVGDGQVSGRPEGADPEMLFRALADWLTA